MYIKVKRIEFDKNFVEMLEHCNNCHNEFDSFDAVFQIYSDCGIILEFCEDCYRKFVSELMKADKCEIKGDF